jgi:hypothetical protein
MEGDSYSKNPFSLKNILTYLIIGGLIYGLIYYVWAGKDSTNPYQAPSEQMMEEEPDAMMEEDPEAMMEDESPEAMMEKMTVTLEAQNDSEETGTATLEEVDGKTLVTLAVDNAPATAQPAHIHAGACPAPGAVVYPLTSVVDGASETTLDVTLAELTAQLPLAINVHMSAAEVATYVSCGDLN